MSHKSVQQEFEQSLQRSLIRRQIAHARRDERYLGLQDASLRDFAEVLAAVIIIVAILLVWKVALG